MECYNQSLCFAEIGSENVALAYSNRSACNFHMMLYKEVLVDIELAKNANLPDRLIKKLEERKNDSMKLMSSVRVERFEPKLSYESDENFPCMANVVEIKYNEEFGRHVVAKCDIPAGRTILVENDIPHIRDDSSACYTCMKIFTNCVACPNCPDVAFCSFDCMSRNQTHKWECGSFFNSEFEFNMKFMINTLLMAIDSFPDVNSLMQFVEDALLEDPETLPTSLNDSKSKYHFFLKLTTSAPYPLGTSQAYKPYEVAINLPKVSRLFDSDRKKRFFMHLVMHHTLILSSNEFAIDDEKVLGYVSSLLNHSCAPNLVSIHSSSHMFSVTGRPIRKGEQLYTRYDTCPNGVDRQAYLKERWGFICRCEICEPTRAPIDRKLITSDFCYKYVVKNKDNMDMTAIVQKKCIKFLNKYGHLPWSAIKNIFTIYVNHLQSMATDQVNILV
ncbi:SET domain-containing protein 3-like isoform X2 [Sitodiplosis mosellana]|nr:SET domain-containing protein 3-like isoform X2 [Sitodiplosis mosellana]